jgi:hypothetical protein
MAIQIVQYEGKPAGKYKYWPMSLFLNVLDNENSDKKPLRNFGKYLPVNIAPYPKRLETPLDGVMLNLLFIYTQFPFLRIVKLLEINLQILK